MSFHVENSTDNFGVLTTSTLNAANIAANTAIIDILTINDNLNLLGTLNVTGDVEVTGDLDVTGDVEFGGNLEVTGDVMASNIESDGIIEAAGVISTQSNITATGSITSAQTMKSQIIRATLPTSSDAGSVYMTQSTFSLSSLSITTGGLDISGVLTPSFEGGRLGGTVIITSNQASPIATLTAPVKIAIPYTAIYGVTANTKGVVSLGNNATILVPGGLVYIECENNEVNIYLDSNNTPGGTTSRTLQFPPIANPLEINFMLFQ